MVETLILGAAFIFGLIGTATGVTTWLLFRKLRAYFGVPLHALENPRPPQALTEQPCELQYRQPTGERGPYAMLVTAADDQVSFRHHDLAAIQAYLDADGYTVMSSSQNAGVAIRFALPARTPSEVTEDLAAVILRPLTTYVQANRQRPSSRVAVSS